MALDATVGGASANSYLTVAEADALADVDLGTYAKRWLLADVGDKERALIKASTQIDALVPRLARWSASQRLRFPLTADVDGVGVPFLDQDVRWATFLQAAVVLANADKLDEAATRRARGMVSFSESDVSGAPSLDPAFGRYHPEVEGIMRRFRVMTTTVLSVPLRSPYYRP